MNEFTPDLEVIARDHEHANRLVVSRLLGFGLIYERDGKLYLTLAGKRKLRAGATA